MLIIAGRLQVDPTSRDAFVDAHRDLVARARETPGCLDLAITADSLDPGRINNYERWESQEALDAWRPRSSPPDVGDVVRDAHVELYEVAAVRPPF